MKNLFLKKEKGMLKGVFFKRKITFLSVIAGVLYVWMLIFPVWDEWEDAKSGFLRGCGVEGYENQEGLVRDSLFEVFYVRVTPEESVMFFPENIQLEGGENVDSSYSLMKIALPDEVVRKAKINAMEILQGIISLIMLVLYLMLPFRFFGLISYLQNGYFFDRRNVRLIRQMSWMIIGLYLCDYLFKHLSWKINLTLFDLKDYAIVQIASDPLWLVIGVVALLLAEVFAQGVLLEEERKLTI
ncbi:DUF2975 domain-containing protein [Marinilabilia salmonicolor]|jgi:hypothetical protein|uniref:DUF2975 family protein n=1 Tax=Marinilabilia salmonicolor TaxID=989 RepID=A0A368V785_9BACT|nr:DUF2975 domain-containing protein [Marinilabilia salmonicolor]RCW36125.1 DUF2975 family protein [Marinilabilia salmonicolor]